MNIYEWCIESLLAHQRQVFCRVRDVERLELFGGPTKNFDYLVRTAEGGLLIEVKGRSFPTSGGSRWENWVTGDDLDALEQWLARFGEGFHGLLAFVYRHTNPDVLPGRPWTPFQVDNAHFGVVACHVSEYRAASRPRSAKWNTVMVQRAEFVKLVRPFSEFLPEGQPWPVEGRADADWLAHRLPDHPPGP